MQRSAPRTLPSLSLRRSGWLLGAALTAALALAATGCKDKSDPSAAPGASGTAAALAPAGAKLTSKAIGHLPAGCEVVLHADIAKTLALPAAQKELVPALDEIKSKADTDDAKKAQELLKAADIDPRKDIHSVAVCANAVDSDDQAKVVVILGGEFRGESVVPATAKADTTTQVSELDGRKLLSDKSKKSGAPVFLTQAADGAILIGNDKALLESALKPGEAYKSEYALPTESELSFNVSEALLTRAMAAAKGNPMARSFDGVKRVFGSLHFTNPGGDLHLVTASPEAATGLSTGLNALLGMLKQGTAQEKSTAGEMEALAAAKTRVDGKDVVIEAPWSAEGVEKAASELAKAIRDANKDGALPL